MKSSGCVPLLLLVAAACDAPTASDAAPTSSAITEVIEHGQGRPAESRCASCHEDAATSWARSRHHTAYTNAAFQRAWHDEPEPFCRDCHAPDSAGVVEPPTGADARWRAALDRGVGCLDCHADGDAIVTGPGSSQRAAPHALVRVDDFGTRSCAGCHEFDFPSYSRRPRGTMMQTTMREHRSSAHAERSCADCHLPAGDHALASSRDVGALRDALMVIAARDHDTIVVSIEPQGIGHAFPTGDLFRRLALHVQAREGEHVVVEDTRYLARHFAPYRRADGTRDPAYAWPVPDDRVAGSTELRLPLPGAAALEWRWWLDYERVASRDEVSPELSSIESSVRIAEGTLAAPSISTRDVPARRVSRSPG